MSRSLKDAEFCSSSRKARILTTGIHGVFRGLKFESDAEIEQKGAFCKGLMPYKAILLLFFFSFTLLAPPATAAESNQHPLSARQVQESGSAPEGVHSPYLQVSGLIDTRTTFSDGTYDVTSLVRLAKERGFEVLFINDHDRMVLEYGLLPFRNTLKKKVELNSINREGAENYLDAVKKAREKYPDMILIPGSESVPFYYWEGSPLSKNLTAHDHEKRLLTIGMEKPEDYQNLPVIHNGFSTRYLNHFLPWTLLFFIAFILGLFLLKEKGFFRTSGVIVSAVCFLGIIDAHPFRSSPFSQYDGTRGIAPYQLLIDYVNSKGGFTFWNYPETQSGVRKLGPVFLHTAPYPDVLEQSSGYTGFAAVYGDGITATEPGHQWDRVLLAYCTGKRQRPVWGIATADFHKDGESGQKLGDFPTVFLVRRKTKADILSALKAGRMYASQTNYPQQILLKEFSVSSEGASDKATLGGEIVLNGHPKIHISLAFKNPVENQVKVRLIRAGKLIRTFTDKLPMEINYEDKYHQSDQKIYYRMDVTGHGILVSNPIFVKFQ
jgi:hypothetical protein